VTDRVHSIDQRPVVKRADFHERGVCARNLGVAFNQVRFAAAREQQRAAAKLRSRELELAAVCGKGGDDFVENPHCSSY
jgi:hypothetical protein